MALPDLDSLHAFLTLARERIMRLVAQKLNISQPPLSRKIARLEAHLGVKLFKLHSQGMELTADGIKALEVIQPLLELAEETWAKLAPLGFRQTLTIGLTTAFAQDIFAPWKPYWQKQHVNDLRSGESPKLAREVYLGRLDAAFVALPLTNANLTIWELEYSERLCAVLPVDWPQAGFTTIRAEALGGKKLFWFQRRRNPDWHDWLLARLGTDTPAFIEEPPEYDVLIAAIAWGQGWGILPQSFASLIRPDVRLVPIEPAIEMRLGLAYPKNGDQEKIRRLIPPAWLGRSK